LIFYGSWRLVEVPIILQLVVCGLVCARILNWMLEAFIATWNRAPKPFIWKASAEDILAPRLSVAAGVWKTLSQVVPCPERAENK
jgi:hypothetical protein